MFLPHPPPLPNSFRSYLFWGTYHVPSFLTWITSKPSLFHIVSLGALSIHPSSFLKVLLFFPKCTFHHGILLPLILQYFPNYCLQGEVQTHWHGLTVVFILRSPSSCRSWNQSSRLWPALYIFIKVKYNKIVQYQSTSHIVRVNITSLNFFSYIFYICEIYTHISHIFLCIYYQMSWTMFLKDACDRKVKRVLSHSSICNDSSHFSLLRFSLPALIPLRTLLSCSEEPRFFIHRFCSLQKSFPDGNVPKEINFLLQPRTHKYLHNWKVPWTNTLPVWDALLPPCPLSYFVLLGIDHVCLLVCLYWE